jgi:hypothetical protein
MVRESDTESPLAAKAAKVEEPLAGKPEEEPVAEAGTGDGKW